MNMLKRKYQCCESKYIKFDPDADSEFCHHLDPDPDLDPDPRVMFRF